MHSCQQGWRRERPCVYIPYKVDRQTCLSTRRALRTGPAVYHEREHNPMRFKKTLAAAVAVMLLGAPAAASAKTIIGSGSTAAEPFLLELFKAYTKHHPSVHFVYTANGGNAGVKDVQE